MSHIIEISNFDAPELDIYARTSENQLVNRANPKEGMFIAESPRVIERALDTGYEPVSCLVEKRQFSCMVALRGTQMTAVPIEEAVKTLKLVDPDCQLVRTARDLGVCFGD